MFGNYLRHVLVLTLLAGIAYSLPQVKNSMVNAFTVNTVNEANVFYSTSSKMFNDLKIKNNEKRKILESSIGQNIPPRMISPEEVLKILLKEGFISKDKEESAKKVLKDYIQNINKQKQQFSSTTPAMMRDYRDNREDNIRKILPPLPPLPYDDGLENK